VRLVSEETGDEVWSNLVNSSLSTVTVAPSAMSILEHAKPYTLELSATSHAGIVSDITSTTVTADLTPPHIVGVSDGAGRAETDLSCVNAFAVLGCSWAAVDDETSGIKALEWALGSMPLGSDLQPFAHISTSVTSITNDVSSATTSATIVDSDPLSAFCTIRATNGAGHVTVASSDGAQVIKECNTSFVCLPQPAASHVAPASISF